MASELEMRMAIKAINNETGQPFLTAVQTYGLHPSRSSIETSNLLKLLQIPRLAPYLVHERMLENNEKDSLGVKPKKIHQDRMKNSGNVRVCDVQAIMLEVNRGI